MFTLQALADRPIWVGWRPETRMGKPTKIPYNPRTGTYAKCDNSTTWASRNDAELWALDGADRGVAIVLTRINAELSLAGIDLDACRDKGAGAIEPWAQEIIDRFATYTEISPSGTGVKVFFTVATADLEATEALFGGKTGRIFKNGGDGDHPPAIEIYRCNRFFTTTDRSIGCEDLRVVSVDDLRWIIEEAGPRFAGEKPKGNGADDSRSGRAFRAGVALKAAGVDYAEMRAALLDHDDPGIADWARTKGLANGEREMHRIFDKAGDDEPAAQITASPFVWTDPADIPPRQWLYGRHYVRSFISETVAPGAYGKSSLVITEALATVTGRPLLGVTPNEKTSVWYWNGEDPIEELQRRIAAACLHHQIDRSEIEGRLFLDTGRKTKIIVAEQIRTGVKIARPIIDAVIATIKANNIGLMIVDPFVASHRVVENDNLAVELVTGAWAEVADVTGAAIELVHHARKTGGAEITVEDGRGASALLAKVRSARTLNGMSEDEAARAGVERRRSFFRVDVGKANLAPPADQADWHRLVSVDLGNGDNVGVVTQWVWPNPFDGVSVHDLRKVQSAVAAGRWRESPQAKDWVGHAVANVLKLDASNRAARAKIVSLLKTWTKNGMFVVVEGEDDKRMPRKFIEVGTPAHD